ncbi:hypothetical protein HDV05_007394 [Chytridiales sp. JEL 0842]|nr:hypothetical protein HDV05_007394 [Chytridiales sp. JEL 0842]
MTDSHRSAKPDYTLNASQLQSIVYKDILPLSAGSSLVDTHSHIQWVADRISFQGTVEDFRIEFQPQYMDGVVNVICDPKQIADVVDSMKEHEEAEAAAAASGTLHLNRKPITRKTPYISWADLINTSWVHTAVGVHPHEAKYYTDDIESLIETLMKHPQVVAWGECGLDYHYDNSPRDIQRKVFIRQIKKAVEYGKPLVVHTREAEQDTLDIFREHVPKDHKVHVHCFTDSVPLAMTLLEEFPNLGIGITNVVTFNSAKNTQEVVSKADLGRLLIETDCPFFIPNDIQKMGKKFPQKCTISHSAMVMSVAKKIANIKQVPLEDVIIATRENARRVYGV